MADTKITALNELTTPTNEDLLAIIDDPSGSAETKKIVLSTLGILDGWITAGETWTYVSSTTFIITGDVTDKYQQGDKVKFTQTTVKYGYIRSAVYGSPNTTITLYANDDYSVADAVISDNYYSKIDNPQGFPHWFEYTPTGYGGYSVAPTVALANFCVKGRMAFVHFQRSSLGTSNSTSMSVQLPIATKNVCDFVLSRGWNSGTPFSTPPYGATNAAGTTLACYKDRAGIGWTASGGKQVNFEISYEI